MPTLEEVMEACAASMQQMADEQAEKAKWDKLYTFLIGDCYELMAAEKVKNLRKLHNA